MKCDYACVDTLTADDSRHEMTYSIQKLSVEYEENHNIYQNVQEAGVHNNNEKRFGK